MYDKFDNEGILRKTRISYTEKYKELKQFIIDNKKLPKANKTEEKNLYTFFYKQRRKFEQGHLEKTEENNFIEIAKIIQSHKYENQRN